MHSSLRGVLSSPLQVQNRLSRLPHNVGSFWFCCHAMRQALHSDGPLSGPTSAFPSSVTGTSKTASRSLATKAKKSGNVSPAGDGSREEKAKALKACMDELNARFGKGTLMFLKDSAVSDVEKMPTGVLTLDAALGGGFPKGRIVEIFGPESSGKTTLALQAIAEVQRRETGFAVLIDAEHAFDRSYARKMGVDTDSLLVHQPEYGEQALEIADHMARSHSVSIVCIDSVAALTPRAELEGEIGNVQVGSQARLMSQAMRKLTANAAKAGCTIIFLNQLRQKVGVIYGNPEVTSGGQALKYYASVRVDVRNKGKIAGPKGEDIGIKVKAKVVKNKCAPPYRTAEFDIMFGSGISTIGCVLDAAEATGVVNRKGAYYYLDGDRLGQGREKTLEHMKANPEVADKIEALTRAKLANMDDEELPLTDSTTDSFDEDDDVNVEDEAA